MKRTLTLLTALMALCMALPVQAQVKFGLQGGLNVTSMKLNSELFDVNNRNGFFLGPTLKIGLPISGIGIDIAALYDQREAKVNDETIKQKNVVVPLNARFSFGLGSSAGIFVTAGPQFGFNLGDDKYTIKDLKASTETAENRFQLKKSNLSVNVGAGVNLGALEIGARYNIAIGKTAEVEKSSIIDTIKDEYDAKTNAWQVYAAIFF
jgi:opacity protein-like surface antigen